jgi:LysM repeat protein
VKSADIKAASKLTSNNLQIGQVLVIPGAKGTAAAATGPTPAALVAPAVTPAVPDVAAPPSAGAAALLAGGTATAPTVAGFPNTLEHTVLEGETLESVAEMYEAKIEDILTANPQVKSNADLKPNITIVVPYK